jgi:hypothetical protein
LDQSERDKIKKALLEYCGQDTLAMVKLVDRLLSALHRSAKMRSANFPRSMSDLTGARKLGSKRWGIAIGDGKIRPPPPRNLEPQGRGLLAKREVGERLIESHAFPLKRRELTTL